MNLEPKLHKYTIFNLERVPVIIKKKKRNLDESWTGIEQSRKKRNEVILAQTYH